jgi:hypothetical protein
MNPQASLSTACMMPLRAMEAPLEKPQKELCSVPFYQQIKPWKIHEAKAFPPLHPGNFIRSLETRVAAHCSEFSLKCYMRNLACIFAGALTLFISGCTTQTRLGYLIPAHKNSQSEQNEEFTLELLNEEDFTGIKARALPFVPLIAPVVAEFAIEGIKSELEKEAKTYESQFQKRLLLATHEIDPGGNYIIFARWVDKRSLSLSDGLKPEHHDEIKAELLKALQHAAKSKTAAYSPFGKVSNLDALNSVTNKNLAFLYVAKIERATATADGAFKMSPYLLWEWQTKAKVVDFSLSEAWKPWQWVGTLFLKTDGKAHIEITTAISALAKNKDGGVGNVNVDTSYPTLVKIDHNLDAQDKRHWLNDRNGAWFDVPRLAKSAPGLPSADVGFVTLEITVNEKDASNAKTLLLKGKDKLDEAKPKILKAVGQ